MIRPGYFIAATDIHKHRGNSNLQAVLHRILLESGGAAPSAVILGGDSVGGGRPPRMGGTLEEWQPVFSPEDVKEEVWNALGSRVPVYITYGSHDLNAAEGYKGFFSGPAAPGDYYLYGISFSQMRYAFPDQAIGSDHLGIDKEDQYGCCAEEASEEFLKWEEGLSDSLPVFVMSHMPLHTNRGDNLGASIWCSAFNEAARRRPVYVFFGHNHSSERRSNIDRMYYRVEPGSIMPVQGTGRELSEEREVKFTYLNGGYIINGCASVIEPDAQPEKINIRRVEIPLSGLDS